MTIDGLGRILWNTSTADAARQVPVTITTTDDHGQSANQTFTLTVAADQTAPAVRVVVIRNGSTIDSTARVDIGATVTFRVLATDTSA
jgi:hypothetical protein